MADKKAVRIQNSILNGAEKKALAWLAERQPKWVVSDMLTLVGIIGALMIGAGFVLCSKNINWLWLSIAGFVVNWYGDSLDGTLARVRNTQRPLYGYYLDHTVDCFNEAFMFLGLGLSYLMRLDIALMILIVYLFLTVNVSVNAHLKSEFKLTYGKLGPTEFRVIACLLIMCVIFFPCIREFHTSMHFLGREVALTALDIAGLVILAVLVLIYLVTVIQDARGYAKADPMPERRDD
ncbi:MAG: CDP-alcohol phosphatidyltransferase family protein [Bacteroidales bacterium]|jgi:phosphatidylglycerophosphate synthase|nr:CDP-alcohol phosphatidyltransferase family protein [Bacteroidales bacterium]MEE3476909.1 CDP-alcohol phosphatidyltransferase family protein [Candidatus Cryptobacteroides sp.]MBQ2197757.1 CDP-alcohol phosphatidyltransferase family protein [Bacteroidales bacterium]MBQ5411620.1 CDP-alcohol phosphatidyltransferase family protein [Bacteroidales bacterium]MBQ6301503.1 CDP-alcohol phosphatidyltransferase family protein [Bacteroidales bacterium]